MIMAGFEPPTKKEFQPFKITSGWKRFVVDPKARCYDSICKILRLHESKDYEIEINVKEIENKKEKT
jgi:hypothetical protein